MIKLGIQTAITKDSTIIGRNKAKMKTYFERPVITPLITLVKTEAPSLVLFLWAIHIIMMDVDGMK